MSTAPELAAVLAHYGTLPPVLGDGGPTALGRATHERDAVYFTPQRMRASVALIEESVVGDREVPVRVYRPAASTSEKVPTVLWIHGGGWVTGSLHTSDTLSRQIAHDCGAVVVSVDYRLAPEHPWPAGLTDVVDAFTWVRDHIEDFGGDLSRIGVGGDSAGGNLAAALAQRARDEGWPLAAQLLVYPVTDCDVTATYPSRVECADGPYVTWAAVADCIEQYLPSGVDRHDPAVSPIRNSNLSGLAPAVVATVELDSLRDEGDAYAAALSLAGVRVVHYCAPGLPHGAFDMVGRSGAAAQALSRTTAAFAELLGSDVVAARTIDPDPDADSNIPARFLHADRSVMVARAEVSGLVAGQLNAAVLRVGRPIAEAVTAGLAAAVRTAADDLLADPSFVAAVESLPWHDGDRIVALGDSITDDSCSWAEQLHEVIARVKPTVTVINHGVTGATTQEQLARIDLLCRQRPTWVIQLLGTNDARRQGSVNQVRMAEPDQTVVNLNKLTALITGEAGARIVRLTPPPVIEERVNRWEPFAAEQISWRSADVAEIAQLIRALDPAAIDLYSAFGPHQGDLILADGVHPNMGGQSFILRTLIAGLSSTR